MVDLLLYFLQRRPFFLDQLLGDHNDRVDCKIRGSLLTGHVMINNIERHNICPITLGGPGFQPITGDFDGDGLSDFAAYSPALGKWDMALSSLGYAKVSVAGGGEGFVPIPGDYDGDGITDIGVYSASQGQGIVLMSSEAWKQVQITLGGPGFIPCNP